MAALIGLAGLAVGAALVVLDRRAPELASTASPPAAIALPPAAESPPAPTPQPPPAPAVSDLPNVDVAPLVVHTVPDAAPPVPTVTLLNRDGRTIKEFKPSAPLSPSYVPSPSATDTARSPSFYAPRGANSRAATAAPILVPPGSTRRLAVAPASAAFDGAARAAGATALSVGGRNVRLFGVRVADPRDQCNLGPGDNRSCAEVARDALAQRLLHYPKVACHVPPGQRGNPAAICTDTSGTDLGGFLVAEGYALADTSQSYDYFGAEGVARSYRLGLWRYR
ncbi:MAG TPA: hypothetical protein VNF99_18290 [Stellaceae bacterium]|nr:hypothetical protein [Stellaceae bacterium]